jgi:hypothetical protein
MTSPGQATPAEITAIARDAHAPEMSAALALAGLTLGDLGAYTAAEAAIIGMAADTSETLRWAVLYWLAVCDGYLVDEATTISEAAFRYVADLVTTGA